MGIRLQGVHRDGQRVEDDARRGPGRLQQPAHEEQPDAAEDHDGAGGAGIVHVRVAHGDGRQGQIDRSPGNQIGVSPATFAILNRCRASEWQRPLIPTFTRYCDVMAETIRRAKERVGIS